MTRNVSKLAVWRGTYSLICDDTGAIIDDGTLFRMAPQLFRWCCGSEESGRWLTKIAQEHNWQVRIQDLGSFLPNLALQGPKSRDILRHILFTQPHVHSLTKLNGLAPQLVVYMIERARLLCWRASIQVS